MRFLTKLSLEKPLPIKKFLVVGSTGSGKSTFINTLANFFLEDIPSLEKLRVVIPTAFLNITEKNIPLHSEKNTKDRTLSQTTKATEYVFRHPLFPYEYHVIDLPGLNDVSGREQDDENMNIIINSAINSEQLSAIILVINGTEARLSGTIVNLLNRLKGSIPDSITDNIITVFTMCRKETCNFDLSKLPFVPASVHYMNNTAFSIDPLKRKNINFLKVEFDQSIEGCHNIISNINEMAEIATTEFLYIKKARNLIKIKLHELKVNLKNIQTLYDIIEQSTLEISKLSKEKKKYENYFGKKIIYQAKITPVDYYSVVCSNCNCVCYTEYQKILPSARKDFLCMGLGTDECTVCPGKCGKSSHYYGKKDIVIKEVEMQVEIAKIKNEFLKFQKQEKDAIALLDQQSLDKLAIKYKIDSIMRESSLIFDEIKKLCRGYNFDDEMNDLLYSLESDAKKLTSLEARKIADENIRVVRLILKKFNEK